MGRVICSIFFMWLFTRCWVLKQKKKRLVAICQKRTRQGHIGGSHTSNEPSESTGRWINRSNFIIVIQSMYT